MRLRLLCTCALFGCMTARPMLVKPSTGAPRAVLFEGVRVFDGTSDALSAPMDVLVQDGRIAAIAPAGKLVDPAAEHVAGQGRTLMPGLIDCHVHLGAGDGTPPWATKRPNVDAQSAALVYSGVTTILAASRDSDVPELRRRMAQGDLAGPRIFASTRIFTAPGGHPGPMLRALLPWPVSALVLRSRIVEVENEQEARVEVDAELADGDPSFVKLVYDDIPPGAPRLKPEVLRAVIAEAKAKGKRASVHVGSPEEALAALEAGASLLMHIPADEALTLEQAQKLAQSGVPIVTTSDIYGIEDAVSKRTHTFSPLEKQVMPPGAEDAFAHPPENYQLPGFPPEYVQSFAQRDANERVNAKLLFDAGARLVAGTDSGLPAVFHGPALHRELRNLVAIGIPAARVLRMATSDAARMLDPHADYGVIAPGMRADLLLIEGDPIAGIAATERIAGVWQDGRRRR